MKIYISGLIGGRVDYMKDFSEAEKRLKEKGYEIVNPVRFVDILPRNLTDEDYLEMRIMLLKHCDAIYLLPDWRYSTGCNREYGYALAAGLTIIDAEKENKDE